MDTVRKVKRKKSLANKTSKRSDLQQKFWIEDWQQFPVIRKEHDKYHSFCTVCIIDFNVSHVGILDVKKHMLILQSTVRKQLMSSKGKGS